jgi:hypothetical protein
MRAGCVLAVLLLLASCGGGGGDWARAGADEAEAEREYQACRDVASAAVGKEADIDQDIIATRGRDWQRGGIGRVESRAMQEHTRDRAASIVAACMRAKGYTRTR